MPLPRHRVPRAHGRRGSWPVPELVALLGRLHGRTRPAAAGPGRLQDGHVGLPKLWTGRHRLEQLVRTRCTRPGDSETRLISADLRSFRWYSTFFVSIYGSSLFYAIATLQVISGTVLFFGVLTLAFLLPEPVPHAGDERLCLNSLHSDVLHDGLAQSRRRKQDRPLRVIRKRSRARLRCGCPRPLPHFHGDQVHCRPQRAEDRWGDRRDDGAREGAGHQGGTGASGAAADVCCAGDVVVIAGQGVPVHHSVFNLTW
ncbi:hypothetical protein DFJ74DRAFT_652647 [Hyaloraphidium curvatum]|nr:hypothetical protein DFJ74DRAFT_652647 [Hyaloraphidium curvatum]